MVVRAHGGQGGVVSKGNPSVKSTSDFWDGHGIY